MEQIHFKQTHGNIATAGFLHDSHESNFNTKYKNIICGL
jgi:hypothetical protein